MKSLFSSTLGHLTQTCFVTTALVIASPNILHAQHEEIRRAGKAFTSPVFEPEPMYPGTITVGVKSSDAYTEGSFSIVAPIYSSLGADNTLSGDLLFIEPYISYGEGGEVATSLGLGWRHLFGAQPVSALTHHDGHQASFWEEGWYAGANVFVDMLDTEAGNQFWQLGVGAEIGTRYIELRGNYYIPLSEKQLAEERRSRQTFRSSHSSSSVSNSSTATALNNPYATGNTVAQDALFTNYSTRTTRTTTTTTTIERLFQRFEEGMEGWDAEIAILVPGLDRYMDVMLIGGYYSFDNQPFGPQKGGSGNVEGWKAGVEIRPVPALIFSGTWYEDERLTGSDWTVGVQMQIPFEAGDLGDGKNFWSRIGDSFKPRRRHLMERMAEPVSRQNTAVKIANSVKESQKIISHKTSTSVKRVTKVVSQSQQHLVLADDIVFVNNGDAVGNGIQTGNAGGDGTAESPVDTIQAGALWAGVKSTATGRTWNVYTQGGAGNYAENVFTTADTKFISSAELISGVNGTTFGTGDRPVLLGGFTASNKEYLGVRGYNILNGYQGDDGIFTQNVRRVEVVNNIIQNTGGHGVEAYTFNDLPSNVLIADNHIIDATLDGVYLHAIGHSNMTAEVHGNEIANTGGNGLYAHAESPGAMTLNASGNLISGAGQNGIVGEGRDASNMVLNLTGNTVREATLSGILVESYNLATLNATLEGNTIELSGTQGIAAQANHGSTLTVTANLNTITSAGSHGIDLLGNDSGNLTATLASNGITSAGDHSLNATSNSASTLNLTAQGNTITDTEGHGILLRSYGISMMTSTLLANRVDMAGLDGIHAEASNGSELTLIANGNTLGQITFSAINVSSDDSSSIFATLLENNLLSYSYRGIDASGTDNSIVDLKAFDNIMQTSASFGVYVDASENSQVTAHLARNSMVGTYQGIAASSSGAANLQMTATYNTIEQAADYGMYISSGGTATLGLILTGNTVTESSSTGILIESYTNSLLTATLTGNTVDTTGFHGIELNSKNDSELNAVLNGNTILNTVGNGVFAVEAEPVGTLIINGTISNTINNVGVGRYSVGSGSPSGTLIINGASWNAGINLP